MAHQEKPQWGFHVTSAIYLDAIAVEGLTPSDQAGFGNVLFFADYPLVDYGDTSMRFPWPDDAWALDESSGEWVTEKPVSPEDVEIFTGKEGGEHIDEDWVPLIPALKAGMIRTRQR